MILLLYLTGAITIIWHRLLYPKQLHDPISWRHVELKGISEAEAGSLSSFCCCCARLLVEQEPLVCIRMALTDRADGKLGEF